MMFQRILLTRMKFIGDVVLTTPIIHTLRDAFPQSHIAYLGDSQAVSLLENNPYLDKIIPFDFSNTSFLYQAKMFWKMISGKYDLTIDLFSNPRSALLTFATGAKVRIGGNARGRRKLYTVRVTDDGKTKTAIEYHYQSLKAIGVEPRYIDTKIFLREEEKSGARQHLLSLGIETSSKIVSMHPGGTWPAKLWGKDKFIALINKLSADNVKVVLTGGKFDQEIVNDIVSQTNAVYVGNLSLRNVSAAMSLANVVVSNDCGIMHMAVAVNTPTIGIFGPGQDKIWFPYSLPHIALRKHVPCNPCHLNVCNRTGYGFMECMNLLTVDEVYRHIMERV
ncbi:MAG: glycosyltransferase family 9 protein [Bacteroidota bacterium]|nr:glycosyltransferase family 9 protein [Bacteroidota bacterium]